MGTGLCLNLGHPCFSLNSLHIWMSVIRSSGREEKVLSFLV